MAASREQEYSGLPSISTMQAPHCPVPQPNLLPRKSRSSRSTESSGAVPSMLTETGRPLTTKLNFSVTPAPLPEIYCSTLMPLASMNFDQLVISFSSLTLNAGPDANDGSVSTLASRARTAGFIMVVCRAFSILALIGSGVPFGTNRPHQNSRSTSAVLRPSSLSVGTSGTAGERLGLVTSRPLTSLPSICGWATAREDTTTETKPPATACAAGPPPLNGTGTACIPVASRMTSGMRGDTLPGPAWAVLERAGNRLD